VIQQCHFENPRSLARRQVVGRQRQSQMAGTGVGERNMNSQLRDPPNLRQLDEHLRSVGLVTLLVGIAALPF
jgi:hypothetical protein